MMATEFMFEYARSTAPMFRGNAGQRGVASKEINPTDMILPIEGQHWGINE
jgi:hypothetical protein